MGQRSSQQLLFTAIFHWLVFYSCSDHDWSIKPWPNGITSSCKFQIRLAMTCKGFCKVDCVVAVIASAVISHADVLITNSYKITAATDIYFIAL